MAGVGFGEWLGELRAFDEAKAAEMAEHYPALKLLDFFEGREAEGGKEGGPLPWGVECSEAQQWPRWGQSMHL